MWDSLTSATRALEAFTPHMQCMYVLSNKGDFLILGKLPFHSEDLYYIYITKSPYIVIHK